MARGQRTGGRTVEKTSTGRHGVRLPCGKKPEPDRLQCGRASETRKLRGSSENNGRQSG